MKGLAHETNSHSLLMKNWLVYWKFTLDYNGKLVLLTSIQYLVKAFSSFPANVGSVTINVVE